MKILSSIFLMTDFTTSLGRTVLSPASGMSKSISILLERATVSFGTTVMSSPSKNPLRIILPNSLDLRVHLASLYLELKNRPIVLTVRRGTSFIVGAVNCLLIIRSTASLPFINVRPH